MTVKSVTRPSLVSWVQCPSSGGLSPLHSLSSFPNLEEQLDQTKKEQKVMVLKVLANFLVPGRATGGKEKLDGFNSHPNFLVWQWVLEEMLKSSLPGDKEKIKKILTGIQGLLKQCEAQKNLFNHFSQEKFTDFVSAQAKAIKDLPVHHSHTLFGGWGNVGGGSGHALFYEFEKTGPETFDVFLYTSTGYDLAPTILDKNKRRILPVVRWVGVPEGLSSCSHSTS